MRGRREKCSNLCNAACHGHGALCIMGGGVCCQQPAMMGKFCDGAGQSQGVLNDIWTPAIRAHFREISAVMTFTWASLSRKCLVKPSLARFELDLSPPQLARLYL